MHIKQKSFSNYARSKFGLLLTVTISYRFIPFDAEHLFFRSHSFWYQNCHVVRSTILWATWAFCVCLPLPPFSQGRAAFSRDMALCSIYRSSERKPLKKAPSLFLWRLGGAAAWGKLHWRCGGQRSLLLHLSVQGPRLSCRSATKLFLVWVKQLRCDPSVASKLRTNFAPLFYRDDIDQPRSEVTWVKV